MDDFAKEKKRKFQILKATQEEANKKQKLNNNENIEEIEETSFLYQKIPSRIENGELKEHLQLKSGKSTTAYTSSLVKGLIKEDPQSNIETLTNKQILLDNPTKIVHDNIEKKSYNKQRKKACISSASRRKAKIEEISLSGNGYEYDSFQPLHNLWLEYMDTLFPNDKIDPLKLLKADFHGCIISVIQSKCPSFIGLSGICLQETCNTFKIITKSNLIKNIPKNNNIFAVLLKSKLVTLHGNNFKKKSAQRTTAKWGPKTLELPGSYGNNHKTIRMQ